VQQFFSRSDFTMIQSFEMHMRSMVQPMRDELTQLGIEELTTPEQVEAAFTDMKGTALVVVNSVCGCAAGQCRPGVARALQNEALPTKLYTVFAGQDKEATAKAVFPVHRIDERWRVGSFHPTSSNRRSFRSRDCR
jgi:hypothetical protein